MPLRGGDATLAAVAELRGTDEAGSVLQHRLLRGLAATFAATDGSVTARLRAALEAGNRWLRAQPAPTDDSGRPVAGASLLVITRGHAVLAQSGPALAVRRGSEGDVVRHPAGSPWLAAGPVDDPAWPALGKAERPRIEWQQWPVAPGDRVLLAATAWSDVLETVDMSTVLRAPTTGLGAELAGLLGQASSSTPPALVATVQPPAPTARERTRAGIESITAHLRPLAVTLNDRLQAAAVAARPLAERGARGTARVLLAALPARAGGEGDGGYRAEWLRLAMAASLTLPLAVIALTWVMRARAEGAPPADGPAPTATAAVSADGPPQAGSTIVLPETVPAATLAGDPADARRMALVGGTPYVLNTALDRVDRVSGGVAAPVLRQGDTVGQSVVAEIEDVFALPSAGPDAERLVALDAAGRLWAITDGQVTALARGEELTWNVVTVGAGFGGSAYVIDRSTGQIYRYPAAETGLGAGERWLAASDEALAEARDLAVDGALYAVVGTELRRYAAGTPDAFSPPDGLLEDPRALYTSPSAGRLLVADGGLGAVLVLEPSGALVAQLVPPPATADDAADDDPEAGPRFTQLHDVAWDEANGVLYVVSGSMLYRAPYAADSAGGASSRERRGATMVQHARQGAREHRLASAVRVSASRAASAIRQWQ